MKKYEILAILLSPTTISILTVSSVLWGHKAKMDWVVAFLTIVIGPVLPVLFLTGRGITDLSVSDRTKRTPLLILAVLIYFLGFIFFRSRDLWSLEFLTFSYMVITIGIAAINAFYMKGSIHTSGIVGPSLMLILLGRKEGFLMLSLIPLVAWARLKAKAHDKTQIIVGGALAGILTLLSYFICLKL